MPQPIDMQTELARATLADRIQQAADRASLLAAGRAQAEDEEEQVLGETQVDESPESQSEHVDPETKRRNPFLAARRKRMQDDGSDEQKPPRADSDEHHFDVSV